MVFIRIFYIYCSPLGNPLGFFEAAQHFLGGFEYQHTSRSTCSANSVASLSKAFGCLTGKDVQMTWEPTLVWTHLKGEVICLLCCVCLAPEISYQKWFLCCGRRERRKGGGGGKSIWISFVKTLGQLMQSEALGNAGRLLKGVLQHLMISTWTRHNCEMWQTTSLCLGEHNPPQMGDVPPQQPRWHPEHTRNPGDICLTSLKLH